MGSSMTHRERVLSCFDRTGYDYDAPGGDSANHMKRDIGLAWLELPLSPPKQ
jgi:hypothetical protein